MTENFIKEYDKELYLFEQKEYCKELAFDIINKLTWNDDFRTEEEVLYNIIEREQKWCNERSKRIGGPYIDLSQIKLKFCKCWVYRYNNAKEEYKTKVVDDFLRAFHKEYFEKVFYTLPTNTLLTTEILQAIKVIAYNRNKKRVVGGLMNGKIKIWDAKTGKCLNVIQGHKSSITTITFSPDGIHIISGSSGSTLKRTENNLKIFNTETTECVRILDGHTQGIASVEYNRAGNKIVSASWDGTIKIWDASTGTCLQTLLGYKNATKLVSWTDDEKQIECISNKYEIKYIDIKKENTISNKVEIKPNNNFRYRKTLLTYGAFIEDAEFSPDGKHVIYFDENGHEVFSDFANVRKTISGESVDDYCFFDVNGYLYVDVVTYDKEGKNLYYANPYGVLERGKWFQFSDTVMCADGTPWNGAAGNYGYANADGTLMVNTYTYDWQGRYCYMQGNGVALY
jgi:WD40 repeat protein